jgi:UDP:flavonoid glycosyltransferase YjiC (YdhE family)
LLESDDGKKAMAAGGLVRAAEYDTDLLYFVSQIPYEWIFPQVDGVIHHGGSGTTHMALMHGRASMIVPHIIDQFVWDTIIAGLGAGPRGIKVGKITTESLEPKILDLVDNPAYKDKAGRMSREDFTEELYQAIISA